MSVTIFPGVPLVWVEQRFLDVNGDPLAGGWLQSYVAGTTTPLTLYTDADLNTPATNPVELDAYGRPPTPLYMAAAGYKFVVMDDALVVQYTFDNVVDDGQVFAVNFGLVMNSGTTDVVSGYQVLVLDRLVTVNSTGGANPCVINLPAVSLATNMVCIKNMGTVALSVTPSGVDTIDGINAAFTVAASASPLFRSVVLVPNGVSGWHIWASHGL